MLCAAQFLVVLDITIVNVALPAIGDDLALSGQGLSLVVSLYALVFGALLLPAGRLADLAGGRRIFILGMGVFGAASLACGLAPGGDVLIAARALQGLGAALLSPAALALLLRRFPEGPARTRALATWGAVGATAASAGVFVGGALVEAGGWRWVFLANVPVALAALLAAGPLLPHGRAEGAVPLRPRALLAVVPRGVLRSPVLLAANAAGMLIGAMMLGSMLLLSLYLQGVLGMSALAAGAGLLAARGTGILWTAAAARVANRVGARAVLLTGMAAMTTGLLVLARAPADGSYAVDVLPGLLILGVAIPSLFLSVGLVAFEGAREHGEGVASGLLTTSQWVGGVLGVAAVSAVGSSHPDAAGIRAGYLVCSALGLAGVVLAGALLYASSRRREREPAAVSADSASSARRTSGGLPWLRATSTARRRLSSAAADSPLRLRASPRSR